MQQQAPSFHDFLTPTISFRRWDYDDEPCPHLCQQAAAARLYSRGTDFTAWYIKGGGKPGSSYMKRFWERSLREDAAERHQGGSIWLLEERGRAVGAVILELCAGEPLCISDRDIHGRWANAKPNKTFQAQAVGRVAMWLDPSLRGRGLMKLLAQTDIVPVLEKHAGVLQRKGFFPFVRASDATAKILQSVCNLPVPGFFRACMNERGRLQTWMKAIGTELYDHDQWAVEWHPFEANRKTRTGAKP